MNKITNGKELEYSIEKLNDEGGIFLLESKIYPEVTGSGPTLAMAEKDLRQNISTHLAKDNASPNNKVFVFGSDFWNANEGFQGKVMSKEEVKEKICELQIEMDFLEKKLSKYKAEYNHYRGVLKNYDNHKD